MTYCEQMLNLKIENRLGEKPIIEVLQDVWLGYKQNPVSKKKVLNNVLSSLCFYPVDLRCYTKALVITVCYLPIFVVLRIEPNFDNFSAWGLSLGDCTYSARARLRKYIPNPDCTFVLR